MFWWSKEITEFMKHGNFLMEPHLNNLGAKFSTSHIKTGSKNASISLALPKTSLHKNSVNKSKTHFVADCS